MRPSPLRGVMMVISVVAGAAILIGLAKEYAQTYALAREAARIEQRRQDLIEQNMRLQEEIRRLQSDDRYIERLARQQLGLVRPGEIELLIVPPSGTAPRGGPEATQPGAKEDTPGSSGVATPGGKTVTAPSRPGPDAGTGAGGGTEPGGRAGSQAPRAQARSWSERLDGAMKRLFGWLTRLTR